MDPQAIKQIEEWLRKTDEDQMKNGDPILSCLVMNDTTGKVSDVFWESVKKYELRLPAETDKHVLKRLREKAFKWAQTFKSLAHH